MTTLPVPSHFLLIGCYYTSTQSACQERIVANFQRFLDLTMPQQSSIISCCEAKNDALLHFYTMNLTLTPEVMQDPTRILKGVGSLLVSGQALQKCGRQLPDIIRRSVYTFQMVGRLKLIAASN